MDPNAIAVFRELADRSPAEREEYYAQEQVPAAVRAEVETLLRFDVETADSLQRFVASAAKKVLLESVQHGQTSSSTTGIQQPVMIGRYEVVRFLGRGGMGEVYLARDPVLDREVAIKLIGGGTDDDAARKRLVQEARAAGRLRHANIVTIFDAGEHAGRSYIAMEYVSGETLGGLIRRQADLPLRRRLELIEGACAGLAHAHRAGVVHLDIKPDNLMLDETGVVKVLDFGIARVLKGEALATRHLAGTLRYMSPEQIEGRPMDRHSDIFSLGCSCFELVAYVPAYVGSTREIVTRIVAGPVPSLLDAVPGIDPRIDAIVKRAMALDPSDRYDDLEDLRVELGRLRGEIDPVEEVRLAHPIPIISGTAVASVAHAPSPPTPLPERTKSLWRSRLIAPIGVTAALVIGVGAFWLFGARTPSETTSAARAPILAPERSEPARPSEPTSPNAATANEELWRRLALGDRQGVIQLLGSSAAARGAALDMQLASDVLEAVRASVLQTRETAGRASGVSSSVPYRSAEERLTRANRLEAAGRPIEALSVLWQAADLYAQSTPRGQSQPPRAPADRESPISAEPGVVSGRVAQPAPQPAVESPRSEPVIPPAAEPLSTGTVASPDPTLPKAPSDVEAVLDALGRYHGAYEALDVSGVLRAFPSLGRDQVEQLRRTFAGMTAYDVAIRNPRVDVQNDSATVRAVVVRRMVPRVGRPVTNEVETEFRLRRIGSGWVIVAAMALNF